MSDRKIYIAGKLFTGTQWLDHYAVIAERGVIIDLLPAASIQDAARQEQYYMMAPAFTDVQIYGAHGKLFSAYPNTDTLHQLYAYCLTGGASHFQPTIATNAIDVCCKCIDAVRDYRKEGGKGCIGLHLEGPWISKIKRGAHTASFIHPPTATEVKALLDYGKDVITMITLAPEVCSKDVLQLIRSYDIVISAGHSNASYEEAMHAFNDGIHAVTHLYNAMSPLQHRLPGFVGAVFNHPGVMASIVPDGHHVDFAAVRIAKKLMGERLFIITDAVTQTEEGPYLHRLTGDKYESNGTLSGSALTMIKGVQNLVRHADIKTDEALRMAGLYPARVLRREHRAGKIEKGFDADFVCLNDSLEVTDMIVD